MIKELVKAKQAFKKPGQTLERVLKEELAADNFPKSPIPNIITNDVAYILINKKKLSTAYTDLTGRFPLQSSYGNQYMLIGYHYDANCIHGLPIKDRKSATLTTAWQHVHDLFTKTGVAPNIYVIDNEIANDLKEALQKMTLHIN